MSLNLISPWLSRPSPHLSKSSSSKFTTLFFLLLNSNSTVLQHRTIRKSTSQSKAIRASLSESENDVVAETSSFEPLLDEDLLSRVSSARDASEALELIAEKAGRSGGVVSGADCCSIISAAFDRGNVDLALSVFYAMRSSFDLGEAGGEMASFGQRWKWSRPDVHTYTLLVEGLAASLRVSDALKMIGAVSRIGVSPGEEVPFGKIVRCPACMIAVSVAQPQHGTLLVPNALCKCKDIVSCSKCRYQYELVSGDIVSIESEEIRLVSFLEFAFIVQLSLILFLYKVPRFPTAERSMEVPMWKRGLKFLQIKKQSIPAAVHSIVVETPSGMARTHKFATETVDLPAQEGERVTIAVAAPSTVYREVGPLKFSPKSPDFYSGEPLCLTNHRDGRESLLLRAPTKNEGVSLLNPSVLFPLFAVLGTGNAVSGMIDPSMPQLISVAVVSSFALGVTLNTLVIPQLGRLPQRLVDVIAIRQQLLSQYDKLQSRIKDLKEAAENEISSMIEIEVEMDSDVLAAEAASNARWKIQAEANDEVERLLSSEPTTSEQVLDI
ncbi:hypothetical protein RHMOL_Rhmol02G0304400 [Rhododendron molle]|uniref:Uncharacterized protein n=1 Tax=Rhododendron molle TaxID=49168 RepID=A0ACC0PW17_RHOML|nr:hypothetical protein RHMOL_Rhmol02G0304400 [Rhododendron molle]